MEIIRNEHREIDIEARANFAYPSYVYEKPEPVDVDPFLHESDPDTIKRLEGKLPLSEIARICKEKKEKRLSLETPTSMVCDMHLLVKDFKIGGAKYRLVKLAVGHGTDKERSASMILKEPFGIDEITQHAIDYLYQNHFYREQRVAY